MIYERSLQAPRELRYIDRVRLTLVQINEYAAAIEEIGRDAALAGFKERHELKGSG